MITFNLGLDTDDKKHEKFLNWARELVGPSAINRIIKKSNDMQDESVKIWESVVKENEKLIPLGIIGNAVISGVPVTKIIAIIDEDEDESKAIEIVKNSPNFKKTVDETSIQIVASIIISGNISPKEAEKRFGISAKKIKLYRKNRTHPEDIPFEFLKQVVSASGLDYDEISNLI